MGAIAAAMSVTACSGAPAAVEGPVPTAQAGIVGVTWEWVATVTPVERIDVADPSRYTLLLEPDGRAQVLFDCNQGGGDYELSPGRLSFGPLVSTMMACPPDTQDAEFTRDLQRVSSYFVRAGELYLELPYDSGTMHFRPRSGLPEAALRTEYTDIFDEPVALVEGRYAGPPFVPGGAARPELELLRELHAEGDLDGDGADEVVVLLVQSMGGSGSYLHLVVLRRIGAALVQAGHAPLGDRVRVRSLEVRDGRLYGSLTVHGPEDPLCCPAREVVRLWSLEPEGLVELR